MHGANELYKCESTRVARAGGGSRGLAHLGVLQALDDVGTPVDVIGGTSQGAFMAALYAQGLDKDELTHRVRAYATAMASPRRLLSDITLPVLSLFSGKMFDGVRTATLEFMRRLQQRSQHDLSDGEHSTALSSATSIPGTFNTYSADQLHEV